MNSDKIEKYRALALKRQSVPPGSPAEDALLDEMDTVWYSMSHEELAEIEPPGTAFRDAMKKVNEQYGETFKRLAQGPSTEDALVLNQEIDRLRDFEEDVRLLKLQLARAQALAEAASGVLSPCDDSEKERGYCVGHGGITRLPCEFAELREALEAFRAGLTKPPTPL